MMQQIQRRLLLTSFSSKRLGHGRGVPPAAQGVYISMCRRFSGGSSKLSDNNININSNNAIYTAGFELPSFSDADTDCLMVDKSLMSDCKLILTRTSSDVARFYQTLSDVKIVEELDFSSHKVFHIVTSLEKPPLDSSSSSSSNSNSLSKAVIREMNAIKACIKARLLDVIVLPVTFRKGGSLSPNMTISADTIVSELVSYFNEIVAEVNLNVFPSSEETSQLQRPIQFGIDFPTDLLYKLNKEDLNSILTKLGIALNENKLTAKVSYFTVATNAFTYESAIIVKAFAKNVGVPCYATETCRLHHQRPVQLTIPPELTKAYASMIHTIYQRKKQHQSGAQNESQGTTDIIDDLMADHQRLLSSSILIEKQYLTKLGKEPIEHVNNNILCLGHFIAMNHAKFHYPEEFKYLWRTKLSIPHIESRKLIKKSKEELRDWALIYEPIVKKVVDSFEKTLHIRKAQLISEVIDAVLEHSVAVSERNSNSSKSNINSKSSANNNNNEDEVKRIDKLLQELPAVIFVALRDAGFDGVFLSSTLVDPHAMSYHHCDREKTDTRTVSQQNISLFYEEVRNIASSFSDQ